jgi:manganese/zinc/iron transport system substrate-binding protein
MTDWVSNIAGESFEVKALLDKGIDPHTYKPSKKDLDAIRAADVIIYHGVHLEGKIIDVLEKVQDKLIIDAAAHVPDSIIISDPNFPASKDPHYWFDTELVRFIIADIGQALSSAYPENGSEILVAVQEYQAAIAATTDSVAAIVNSIPEDNRLVVTTHDALSYWARTFNMKVNTLQGASTVSEFGLKEVTDLVNFICAEGVPAIFLENIVSPQAMESVQRGCEAKGCPVVLGPELLSDSLGPETDQDTYLEMLVYNANLLAAYLK